MPDMPDPKLKAAMEDIKSILDFYDIAAIVHLQSKTHGEYLYSLSPTWSCATLSNEGVFRFKAAVKSKPDTDKELARATSGMIIAFLDAAKKQEQDMTQVAIMIGQHLHITHRTDCEQ
jgi:hypothetical protein